MKRKILTIFGTRPEAIKLAPVIKELERFPDTFESVVCVTAQHREMLDQVLGTFDINPDYDLGIMEDSQDLFDVTSKVLLGMKSVLNKEKPHIVLVQGDTTTTFVAGLAAFYNKIPVGHVEAGLRSFNKFSPFPEEINRKLTSSISDFHFAPTKTAKKNLLREGVDEKSIFITGNTVIDALLMTIREDYDFKSNGLDRLDFSKKIVLVTAHRRESFGKPFEELCLALKEISEAEEDALIVYPVHLNPNVQKPVNKILQNLENVLLIEPLEYEPFVQLMNKSYLIITDSGGIQEEAPSLGKPVLVMRDVTERPEAVSASTVKIVGTDRQKVFSEAINLLRDKNEYNKMAKAVNPYGDGRASERIISILASNGNLLACRK